MRPQKTPDGAPASAPDPWHRRPRESTLAYRSFVDYLFMGPERSLAKVAHKNNRGRSDRPDAGLTQLKKWSRRWGWRDRVAAYDDEQARVNIDYHSLSQRVDVVANNVINVGLVRLSRIDVDSVTQAEAVRAISDGMRLKSQARAFDQPAKKTRQK